MILFLDKKYHKNQEIFEGKSRLGGTVDEYFASCYFSATQKRNFTRFAAFSVKYFDPDLIIISNSG